MFLARDGPLNDRKTDRAASREKSLRKHRSKLRELNNVTAAITQHVGLAGTLDLDFDSIPSPPLTPSESVFLDATDLSKGRYFQDSLLPISLKAIEQNPAVKSFPVNVASPSTASNGVDEPAESREAKDITDLKKSSDATVATKSPKELGPGKDEIPNADSVPSGPLPVNPPSFEYQETPRHRPRTVHLPPKEVQEERLREKQLRQELRRKSIADLEKHAGEPASSPSTIGAASTATPMPADHSPVTSADEESALAAVQLASRSKSARSAATAEQERDSLLESQKEIARRDALGDEVDSPDVQLRLEQEQAAKATRDAAAAVSSSKVAPPSVAQAPTDLSDATSESARASALVTSTVEPKSTSPVKPPPEVLSKIGNNMAVDDSAPASTTADNAGHPGSTRMTTRVSSGAMKQRSVSEILNDHPRTPAPGSKRTVLEDITPKTSEQQTMRRQRRSAQDKVQTSPKSPSVLLRNEGYAALKGAAEDPARDYLEPLFRIQIHEPPTGRPLHELLQKACKVVSTADQFAGIHEKQDQRILRRIYQLQNANRWSLRQMEPSLEPAAPKTHMDHLLTEMKWMRTDFRQERKIKRATAKYLAEQCAEWINADQDVRQAMQVSIRPAEMSQPSQPDTTIPHSPAETNAENGDRHSQGGKSPPGLDDSNTDAESMEDFDMPRTPQYATVVPSSFFSAMNMDKDTIHLQESEAFHSALADLPLLTPFEDDRTSPQSMIRRPVPAVSKFCEGKIMTKLTGPKRKRSRFDYEDEEELLGESGPSTKRPRASVEESGSRPEQTDVALFDPENKLLRVRLHANTAFRPPSEFQMPSSQFYEFRTASQWTEEDQQNLRRLAKDYSFNWSLIADDLSLDSKLTSAADRRTPWECFERWVELESLPNEMRKTLYFKTWNQRLEAASRNNEVRYQTSLQQQSQTPGQPQTVMRRKTLPFKVDKRRQNRYLHTVDAMRKLARKREQQAHKHAEAQKAAHMRKQHENAAPKSGIPSPQEFSRMRQERDMQIAARQERYREQVLAQQRATQMQRAGQFSGQQQSQPNAGSTRPGPNVPHPQNTPLQPGHPQQGVNHTHPQTHPNAAAAAAQRNGHLAVPQMNMQNNVPQAQMQPNMRGNMNGQAHGTPDNAQQRMLEAQRAAQIKGTQMNGQQYQMAPPNRVSPGGVHAPNGMMANQSNPAMMNSMQAPSSTPNRNPIQQAQNNHSGPNGTASASPHMPPPPTPTNQSQPPQQLSSGHIPAIAQISHQIQSQHPQATPEKIKEMTNEHMRQLLSQQSLQARQSALNAAAGPHVTTPSSNNSPAYNQNQVSFHQNGTANGQHAYNNTPTGANHQQYSQLMRQRIQSQIQQQSNTAGANASPRVPQASPNMTHPSPNMTHPSPNMTQSVPVGSSRTPTPQMARIGSSGGGAATTPQQSGMQSPGLQQSSPRPVPAGVARQ